MITKYKKHHRIIATVFLLIFFPTLVPNNLLASNNGPIAPEATSFEPVDATDMVNLNSGDLSYVLPLLNVPSPEGGYPLALSYHAGIAMDEEASWVGLGWSLNPGAINRSVKGVPDDWGNTRVSDLLYDKGQNLDYYDFSIGGTLPNGITIGMSRSWGAHRAWGGVVGYGGVTVGAGSENIAVSAYGASVGYNLDSEKISGSYTLSASVFASLSINTSGQVNMSAMGISYDTSTDKVSSPLLNVVNKNGSSASTSDYYINNSSKGFNADAAGFYWISYQHTHIEYSLFKLTSNYISGTLNLFDSKKESGYVQDGKNYMDVRSHYVEDKNRPSWHHGVGLNTQIILPNYDNYSVSAQGISGAFSPRNFDEVLLYDKGTDPITNNPTSTLNADSSDMSYLTNPSDLNDAYYKLNNKLFFYFDNVNSSFLRTQTGDFKSLDSTIDVNNINITGTNIEERLVKNIVTDNDSSFSSLYNKEGYLTKTGNRKRDGNFIEAFTNKQIVEGETNGQFFEVPDYDRQFYKGVAENGIGAYRITALDGKVYHFSLPVYNFEEVYKNYTNAADENDKFLETIKTKPYATHWLLTAITGPDFVDVNNNNIADEGDYGYWVKFEYGKWSNGYGWRSPKVGGKVYNNRNFYFWGRKEIYYLDKIKTRTHTALFVKSVRTDDKSTPIYYRKGQYQSGAMPRDITENFEDRLNRPIEQGKYYSEYPTNTYQTANFDFNVDYKHRTYKYVDLPENLSLKLDKIILIKNADALNVNKNLSSSVNRKKGYTYFDYGFLAAFSAIRKNPYDVKVLDINSDQNLLDNSDIVSLDQSQGFEIQSKALKVINFGYNYTLGSNLPNASQGRLKLRMLEFNGKNNSKVIPPYYFNYSKENTPYNFTNTDNWGYVKDNPDAWSLNQITTPIGTKIKIEYEPDSFSREAAYHIDEVRESSEMYYVYSSSPTIPLKHTIQDNIITINTSFYVNSDNLNDIFDLNQDVDLNFTFLTMNRSYNQGPRNFLNSYTIIGIDNINKKLTLKTNEKTDLVLQKKFFEGPFCYRTGSDSRGNNTYAVSVPNLNEYAYGFRISANYNRLIGEFGRNGKPGGGVRVSKVNTCDYFNNTNTIIEYNYFNPYTNRISGVTSFEPTDNPQHAAYIQAVEEIPSPDVSYEYVTATIKNNSEILYSTIYNFRVMDDIMLSDPALGEEYEYKFGGLFKIKFFGGSRREAGSKNNTSKITLYDNFSNLGQLLSVKKFNNKNHLLESTINKYKQFQDDSGDNGTTQESFKYINRYRNWEPAIDANGKYIWRLNTGYAFTSASKVIFPSQLESTSTTQRGYTNTIYFDKYDFLTGQVVESHSVFSDGQSFRTRVIPAYIKTKLPYKSMVGYTMGSKVDDLTNKNMLSQTAANYSYILDKASNTWKETGVGITTWSNVWSYKDIAGETNKPTEGMEKIWRKHKSFVWNGVKDGNGIFTNYDSATDDGFDWTVGAGTQPAQWKQTSETTLYNHYSALLEMKDINGNFATTKMGDMDTKVTATGNAGYSEMFFVNAETARPNTPYLEPEVISLNASRTTAFFHTGKRSVATTSSSQFAVNMRNLQHRAGKYKVSVWVEKTNAAKATLKVNGAVVNFQSDAILAGNWQLKTAYITVPSSDCSIYLNSADTSTVYFDDLMIRPVASSITGYVYNEWDELTHIIGNNGLATRFEYDEAGRLVRTYSEVVDDASNKINGGFKLVKSNAYNNKYL
jgi:YD repeat-containing protein